jgi:hypothetical protein
MSDPSAPAPRLWRYRFTDPDGGEIEVAELTSDEAAEDRARELSGSHQSVVVVHRHSGHVDAWEYVSEADERG